MPCFSTKAFCAPMARISESPSENPEKKALKEFILSLKFGVFWCFSNFVRKAYDKKLGEVDFATCGDFCKFVSQILAASRCRSRQVKFEVEICEFDFKFKCKTIRRSIFVLDEALLNLATGVTVLVMTEPNLKVTKYRAKRQAVI